MIDAIRLHTLQNSSEQSHALARQELSSGELALLRDFIGVQRIAEQRGMARKNFVAVSLGHGGTLAQAL